MPEQPHAPEHEAARRSLLRTLRRAADDPAVVDAIAAVPRERFVPASRAASAYANIALPIGDGQTISQPLMVALMTSALALRPTDRVLEVGTGSGYQAAVLSLLAAEVVTVERLPSLAESARRRLQELGYANVEVFLAGRELGRPEDGPYDAILVAAGAPEVPKALVEQLAPNGRMAIPIGEIGRQQLVLVTRTPDGQLIEDRGACAFVPLIGQDAWPEGTAPP